MDIVAPVDANIAEWFVETFFNKIVRGGTAETGRPPDHPAVIAFRLLYLQGDPRPLLVGVGGWRSNLDPDEDARNACACQADVTVHIIAPFGPDDPETMFFVAQFDRVSAWRVSFDAVKRQYGALEPIDVPKIVDGFAPSTRAWINNDPTVN